MTEIRSPSAVKQTVFFVYNFPRMYNQNLSEFSSNYLRKILI